MNLNFQNPLIKKIEHGRERPRGGVAQSHPKMYRGLNKNGKKENQQGQSSITERNQQKTLGQIRKH